ncbi:MAG: sulfatase [Bryobacteraceae bacterium]|nr:sulfatase [Bryobacteraceae bacterium]
MSLNRRMFLQGGATAGLLRGQPRKPNIVMFLADDHGYFDSPVYGNRSVRTPNMQRLASDGMTFTNMFSPSPTCVPSRSIISTGLLPARNGAERNHSGVGPGIRTLPTYMKSAGYHVAHFGKSHFQPKESFPDWEWVHSEIQGGRLNADLDTRALRFWLEARANNTQPLCLFVCSHSPHVYWRGNEGYDAAKVDLPPTFVDTPETREARTQYYSDVTFADRQLGETYDLVKQHLGGNTLFIYTSDNGAQWPFAKWSLYDAGIRLPFIASWPGVIRPGSRTGAMASFCDLLPTFLDCAGAAAPSGIDGRSFAKVLRGTARTHRTAITAAHSGDGDWNVYPMRCLRTTRFKYILNLHPEFEYHTHIDLADPADGRSYFDSWVAKAKIDAKAAAVVRRYYERPAEELYDITADPHEMKNLAADTKYAGMLREMRERLRAIMNEQGDQGRVYGTPRLISKAPQ